MRHKVKDMTQATSCFTKRQRTYSLDKISLAEKPVFVNGLWFPAKYGDIKQLSFDIRVAPF